MSRSASRTRAQSSRVFLTARGTSAQELIESALASVDVEATLRRGGLTDSDLAALRERLAG
jgi:hypothetical protein